MQSSASCCGSCGVAIRSVLISSENRWHPSCSILTARAVRGEEEGMMEGNGSALTERIIGCAIEVHRQLGPGLLESTYQTAMGLELAFNQIPLRI